MTARIWKYFDENSDPAATDGWRRQGFHYRNELSCVRCSRGLAVGRLGFRPTAFARR